MKTSRPASRVLGALCLSAGALALSFVGDGYAQEPAPAPPPTEPAPADPPPKDEPAPRDPFTESDRMRGAVPKPEKPASEAETGFVPAKTERPIPAFRLRGYVKPRGGEPQALLEIGAGETLLVRKGDTFSVSQGGTLDPAVFRVTSLDRLSATIEVGTLGRAIVVR